MKAEQIKWLHDLGKLKNHSEKKCLDMTTNQVLVNTSHHSLIILRYWETCALFYYIVMAL